MQANDLLKYRDKIINAFKQGTFLSESSKKESKDVQNNFELEDVISLFRKLSQYQKILIQVSLMSFLNHRQLIMQSILLI